MLLRSDSPLKRLPPHLDRRQMVFLDGIRHAAEIAELAYQRLRETLTLIALTYQSELESPKSFTSAFLDAWATVDAIDRLRGLVHLMPGVTEVSRSDGQPGFREHTQAVRDLRNVADHLAQRVDYVIAKKSAALGILSWFTLLQAETGRGLSCVIVPGTIIAHAQYHVVNPLGHAIEPPTDLVTLSAGEYSACLSEVMREVARVVSKFESGMDHMLESQGVLSQQAGADILVVVEMQFH